jgi:hypothetical protein
LAGKSWRIEGKTRGLYLSRTFTGIGSKARGLEQAQIFTYALEIFTFVGNKLGGLYLSRLPIGI